MQRTIEPLDAALNGAIRVIAERKLPSGFDVSDNAPATYTELRAHLDAGKRMLVWSGGSDRTIYGNPAVNLALRAWHDLCHYRGRFPFTPEGEASACAMQYRDLVSLFGDSERTQLWRAILQADIVGQALYVQRHGRFPEDQRAFVDAYLLDASRALAANW